jgi:hypothetical protein
MDVVKRKWAVAVPTEGSELFSLADAARYLGVTPSAISALIRRQKITWEAVEVTVTMKRIRRAELDIYQATKGPAGRPPTKKITVSE